MQVKQWVPIFLAMGLLSACKGGDSSSSSSTGSTSSGSASSSSGTTSPANKDSIKISEIVAKNGLEHYLEGNDWIELKNNSANAVNLSEYSIKDTDSELVRLPSVVVNAGDYYVIQASGEAPETGDFLPFKLGGEDSISLVLNGEEVDSLAWKDGEAKQGRSYGHLSGSVGTLYPTPIYDNAPYGVFDVGSVRKVVIDVEDGGWDATMQNPAAEQYYRATFNLNGAIIEDVGFRTKGQGSLNTVAQTSSHRHGFKVDFNEYQDQKFMGMKKLVFNNSFADPSLMRDFLAYKLMKEAGVPAPETSYVDLWVENEHLGLYLMVEAIDTEFLEKYFPDDKESDLKGDLFKGELFTTLEWVDDDPASYIQREVAGGGFGGFGGFGGGASLKQKTNEEVIGTPEEGKSLIAFLRSIDSGSIDKIDADIMVRYLAASALNGNMDSPIGPTANNFYLYDHMSLDKYTILPWDYNLGLGLWGDYTSAIGGFGGGGGGFGGPGDEPEEPVEPEGCMVIDHVIDHPANDTAAPRPMIESMLANATVKADYRSQLQSLTAAGGAFDPVYLEQEIMKVADLIDPYVKADPTMFFTYNEWKSSLTQDMPEDSDNEGARGAGIYGPAPGLIPYIKKRAEIVRRQLEGSLPSNNSGDGSACPD